MASAVPTPPNTARHRRTFHNKSSKDASKAEKSDVVYSTNSISDASRPFSTFTSHGRAHSYPSASATKSLTGQDKSSATSNESSQAPVLMLASMLTTLMTQIPTSTVKKVAQTLYNYQSTTRDAVRLRKHVAERATLNTDDMITEQHTRERTEQSPNDDLCRMQIQPQVTRFSQGEESGATSEISQQLANQAISTTSQQPQPTSTFTRQLFIHSITHLLRALPQSLTADEVSGIASALPSGVISSLSPPTSTNSSSHCCCDDPTHNSSHLTPQHPTVHRLASISTFGTITIIKVLTPHVKVVAAKGWVFFREHKLAERGTNLFRGMGELGLKITTGVFSWMDLQTLFLDEDYDYLVQQAEHFTSTSTGIDDEMYTDVQISSPGANVAANIGQRKRRAATRRRIIRGVGTWVGGLVSSGIGGMVEGFSSGLESDY